MDRFCKGDVVRSRHGWDAIVSGYDGEKVLLHNVDPQFGRTADYPYSPEDFTLVSSEEPATDPAPQSESPTLLDQFAMHALTGLISNDEHIPGLETIEDVAGTYARLAYTYAQAMLKARPQ